MENLFSPCTRLRDILAVRRVGYRVHQLPMVFRELNLNVSTEDLLSAERAFTYEDLHTLLKNGETYLWLTPHASVVTYTREVQSWNQLHDMASCFTFEADGKEIRALARSADHLLEICDVVLRLLAASVVHSVTLNKRNVRKSINVPPLVHLIEQCQFLKSLSLHSLVMDENHCRMLGSYSRSSLEIELSHCLIMGSGGTAMVEVLRRNQGPTQLHSCDVIDRFVLADGLRGNSRLKIFGQVFQDFDSKRQILEIANAVRENKGLVELSLRPASSIVNDDTLDAVCDSVKTHPTLEVLDLRTSFIDERTPALLDELVSRMQALVDLIKQNTSIHTIHVDSCYSELDIYRASVIPYLETNRFRPRLLAIQKTRSIDYRAKLLGRALLAVRTDANSFWMLLSGNAEVAFPSRTTTIAVAANVPTPAITASTSTANVAAVAAPVMSALTSIATGSLPAAAASAATTAAVPTSDATHSSASDAFASTPAVVTIPFTTSAVTPSSASASDAFASTPDVVTAAANAATNATTPSAGQKRKVCL